MEEGEIYTETFVVSNNIYQGFKELFRDNNPLHTNAHYAREKGFKDIVMHGNILNGFISYFVGECLPTKNVILLAQNIAYKNPVYVNDTLNFTAQITSIHHSVNVVEFNYSFKNLKEKTVAKGNFQIGLI